MSEGKAFGIRHSAFGFFGAVSCCAGVLAQPALTPALSQGERGAEPARDDDGFLLASAPREWSFPRDFGRHDGFGLEWWYFTGNVNADDGREFGYQLTFFRNEFTPKTEADPAAAMARPSPWRTRELYFAHAAISDIGGQSFWHADRSSRARPGLAEASDKTMDVRLLDWSCVMEGDTIRLSAGEGDHAIELTCVIERGPILQGPGGLNKKGSLPGQGSYYYSLCRLRTSGTLTVGGDTFKVSGLSWMDQEFSSNQLSGDQEGWDWFSIQLADGRDVMAYQLRATDGGEPYTWATVVERDGSTRYLTGDDVRFVPGEVWTSGGTGGAYPQRWTIAIDGVEPLTVRTRFTGQELISGAGGDIAYFEGAMEVLDSGGVRIGLGYVEMTGYDRPLAEDF
ncbi:MAG: lipocalin-like domain-containing protein [Planctomycetota bacterium]